MTKAGKLLVQLKSDSIFFGRNVPIHVRDSNMRLVQRSSYDRQFDLPVGLYEVSAVLEDGNKHSQLVQVREGELAPVELGAREEIQEPVSIIHAEVTDVPAYKRQRFTKEMESLTDDDTKPYTEATTQLLDVTGASLIRETRTLWIFRSSPDLDSVPTALIRINKRKTLISLPASPQGRPTENTCVVKVEETRTGAHVNAWISPKRSVANALQNMLASGYVLHAANVADDAVELLQYKYSDPTGAALGALILHKVGRLRRWASWVENLARDFGWMPDGKVMLANLLYENESTRPRAFELAMQASKQRMLYTESYSLLLDLLRRWPRNSEHEAIHKAINALASRAPYIDWESICLSDFVGEE